jgi:hypothetical protein
VSDFRIVPGFEDVWRPPAGRRRTPETVLGHSSGSPQDVRARLARVVRKAPEVMVKVTGRTRNPAHLRAHLDYISRNGQIELEAADGARLASRDEVRDVGDDWSFAALADSRRRANSPLSLSIILSMPADTDPLKLSDAARAFAAGAFEDRFDYVFALHTDTAHPHVHLTVACRGVGGERLNPKKADLEAWRQLFAECLRDRGVEAEATPRRARGVTRKAERGPVRRQRERWQAGGPAGRVRRAAYQSAALNAFGAAGSPEPWKAPIVRRQQRVRTLYLAQARLLLTTGEAEDAALALALESFVAGMPAPETQRDRLARELSEAGRTSDRADGAAGRDRTR